MNYFLKFLSTESVYCQLKIAQKLYTQILGTPLPIQLELKQWHDNKKTFIINKEAFEVSLDCQERSIVSWMPMLFCCWFHYLSSLGYYPPEWRSGPKFTESQKSLQNIFLLSYWSKATSYRTGV